MATNFRSGFFVSKSRDPLSVFVTSPTSKQFTCATGVPNGTEFGGGPVLTSFNSEVISYTQGRKRFNKCDHRKTAFLYSGDPASYYDVEAIGTGVCTHYTGHHAHAGLAHALTVALSAVSAARKYEPLTSAKTPLEYANLAMDRLKPDLTQLSLPNFLLDAGQLKDLVKFWKSNVGLAKNLAGGFLNYKFGWRPTVGDIKGMLKAVAGLDAKLRRWDAELNKIVLDRCSLASTGYSASGSFDYTGNTHHPCKWTVVTEGKVQAFIKYRILPLKALSELERGVRGYLDAFGVELNPQIIWDKIPFTFVIDWFFGVGTWLSRFKLDALELPIYLEDFALQYKQVITVTSQLTLDLNDPTIAPTKVCEPCVTRETSFVRYPIVPDPLTLSGLGWKMPTMNQWRLTGALATVLAPSGRRFNTKGFSGRKVAEASQFIRFVFK